MVGHGLVVGGTGRPCRLTHVYKFGKLAKNCSSQQMRRVVGLLLVTQIKWDYSVAWRSRSHTDDDTGFQSSGWPRASVHDDCRHNTERAPHSSSSAALRHRRWSLLFRARHTLSYLGIHVTPQQTCRLLLTRVYTHTNNPLRHSPPQCQYIWRTTVEAPFTFEMTILANFFRSMIRMRKWTVQCLQVLRSNRNILHAFDTIPAYNINDTCWKAIPYYWQCSFVITKSLVPCKMERHDAGN